MKKRLRRLHRINGVQREFAVIGSALELLRQELRANPNWGDEAGWTNADFLAAIEKAEPTYMVRLFAEFEAGLRDVWLNHLGRNTTPGAEQLVASMAARFGVPTVDSDDVQNVRALRNLLVHEGEGREAIDLTLGEAKSRLCRFFSRMPLDW
jgi:hypothetical protein